MERLRQRDITALLRFIQDAYAIRDLDTFPTQLGSVLEGLIANDYYVHAEVDGQTQKTLLVVSQPSIDSIVPNFQEIFDRYGRENPLLTAHQRYLGALKISDFLTQRQFRRLPLYNEMFRPGGVHYQMSVVIPAGPGILRGIVVNRGTLDFSERERLLLDIVRPHIVQARENAEILDLGRRAIEGAGREIVCMDSERRITFSSRGVSSIMSAYFQGFPSRENRLPEELDQWVREQQSFFQKPSDNLPTMRPMVVDRGDKRLVIRFASGIGAGQRDMLLLDEQQVHVSAAELAATGLSPREAEVLSLVIQGRTVVEIGQILVITTSTVEKHLENIYLKLGVHSRAAAVARAFETLRE